MKNYRIFNAITASVLAFLIIFTGCTEKQKDNSSQAKTEVSSSSTTEKSETTSEQDEQPVDADFFDDTVFIGDSITLGLRNYVKDVRNSGKECLGKAQFLTAGSMGFANSLNPLGSSVSVHPLYDGKEVRIEDGVKLLNAKKAFIMLGMNDFCIYPNEMSMDYAKKCIAKITDENPGIKIYIQSVTPALFDKNKLTNSNIDEFNECLKALCEENGWTYVDVASVLKDEDGILIRSYCGDAEAMGIHMTYDGCKAWVGYLNETFN